MQKVKKSLTSNKYTVKDPFAFAAEILGQDSEFFIWSLDADYLFTNIPFEGTTDICTNIYAFWKYWNRLFIKNRI